MALVPSGSSPITPGSCYQAQEAARNALNAADIGPEGEFGKNLRYMIEVYGGLPEQLGTQLAMFAAGLPRDGDPVRDGYIAKLILDETAAVLETMLDEGDYLVTAARGEDAGKDLDPDYLRGEGRQYNLDFRVDSGSNQEYRDSAAGSPDDFADDHGIRQSYYRAGNVEGREDEILESAQGERRAPFILAVPIYEPAAGPGPSNPGPGDVDLNGPAFITAPPISSSSPNPDPTSEPKIQTYSLEAPDYSRTPPDTAFRRGMTWFAEVLCVIASGSRTEGSYPRMTAIMTSGLPQNCSSFGSDPQELLAAVALVRKRIAALKPPSGGADGGIHDRIQNLDPNDHDGMRRLFEEFLGPRRESWQGDPDDWRGDS